MGGENNQVHIITSKLAEKWPDMKKTDVAVKLTKKIVYFFKEK